MAASLRSTSKTKNNEAVWQQAYEYDRLNNITGIERSEGQQTYQQQFGYDVLQRLIKDQGPYGQQRFEYDEVGNRLTHRYARSDENHTGEPDEAKEELTRYFYAPASNRLLGTSEKDVVLDPRGNTLLERNDTNRSYDYNAQNRISAYREDGELKPRYHYNALGQRIHKAVLQADGSEEHTLFHYDHQGQLLGETRLNSGGAEHDRPETQNIVWLQVRPVAAIDTDRGEAPRIAWLHSDHLLTARVATNEKRSIVWRWHSDGFGVGEESNAHEVGPALTWNMRFPGQYRDEERGTYYNYLRTYDPDNGRYTQSDPLGLLGGINTYAYGNGNPLTTIDIFGLCASSAQEQLNIRLGYTKAAGHDVHGKYHTFVIVHDPKTSNEYITRAGPSANSASGSRAASGSSSAGGSIPASGGNGSSGGFGFGIIQASYGLWTESIAFDKPSDTVYIQNVGTMRLSYTDVVLQMIAYSNKITSEKIPYFPTGPNSNTYAFSFLEELGFARPTPALSAPGWNDTL